jgi:enterochelin esterase family protein
MMNGESGPTGRVELRVLAALAASFAVGACAPAASDSGANRRDGGTSGAAGAATGTGGSGGTAAGGAAGSLNGGSGAGTQPTGGTSPLGGAGGSSTAGASSGGSGTGGSDMGGGSGGGSGAIGGSAGSGGSAAGSGGAAGGTQGGAAGMGGKGGPLPDPGTEGDGDFEVGPTYTTQPDLTDRGAPKGRSFQFSMTLADSDIFDGTDSTLDRSKPVNATRSIQVYVPAQYQAGTPAPVLVIQDGPGELSLVKNALDNLTIAQDTARRIPPFIAVAVQNGGNDSKGSERGLEYDTMSDRYARFISLEVLPAVVANSSIRAAYPNLTITADPNGRAALGCSSGGAAALTMGWFRPDLFRRLITYSGTFVDQQDDDAPEEATYPLGAWDYHSGKSLIANTPKQELRIFLNVNESDLGASDAESTHHNWVTANQRTAAALKAKGYHYRYVFGRGKGHCDGSVKSATLADALIWVWRGYQ